MKRQTLKKIAATAMALAFSASMVACGDDFGTSSGVEPMDVTKSQLYVYNYDGGFGTEWLYAAKARFEEAYAETSFEEGKKGIQVQVSAGKSNLDAIATSSFNVFFTEQVFYNDLIAKGLLLDISDMVTSPLSNVEGCTETKSIKDKLPDTIDTSITALDGKYYVVPHYESYGGLTYDRALFDSKNLFIKEGGGWTNLSGSLSVGPDGIRNTSDDGLPSSYEEFYALLDRMVLLKIVPFIYSGQYAYYANDLPLGLWASYTGYDEFMLNYTFDSGEGTDAVTTEIVTSFNGDTPIIEKKAITPETGYLLSQQAGKYYALEVMKKVMSDSRYSSDKITDVLSHLDTQTEYVYSSLENEPIGMIIEGSWWYNEAKTALAATVTEYGEEAANRDFAWMPLPRQATGQVTEGNGTKNTLYDQLSAWAFVNGNIKNDAAKVKMAKTFLQFCYTDSELVEFTKVTSSYKAVNYEIGESDFAQLSNYGKSIVQLRSESDVIRPYSNHPIFLNNQSSFNNCTTSMSTWLSTIGSTSYSYPHLAFKDGKGVTEYFKGLAISETKWNELYSKYFN